MEYLQTPYSDRELKSDTYVANKAFLDALEVEALRHRIIDHPFLKKLSTGSYSKEGVAFALTQFGKIVMPFTGAICLLMGRAPDYKSRFMLMDNLYEEMGGKNISNCHPMLYIKMLDSIGVSKEILDATPTISSIRILNDAIYDAVANKSFAIGCSWLGYGGELPIPNNFPFLSKAALDTFGEIDKGFWDRHGARDQEHSDDATTVLCMNTDASEYDEIRQSVMDSLNIRAMVWDELEAICEEKYKEPFGNTVITGKESVYVSPEHQVVCEYYDALNRADIEKMRENWSPESYAAFTNPLGGIVRTHEAVAAAHKEFFDSPIDIDVEYHDITFIPLGDAFCTVGQERGTMRIGDKTFETGFRTSRLFHKVDGAYKQVHHHGSLADVNVHQEILKTLGLSA